MNPMEQRFAGIFPFERGSGHFFYAGDSDLSALMHDLKYRHYKGLAEEMGKIVAQELITTPFLSDIDMILPIPMHFLKKARRGYNQTEEIYTLSLHDALPICIHSITGIPVKTNLRATRPHRTQTKLTFDERRNNTKGIFKVTEECELKGKHILLLDDVCTTGSTLTSAATEILQAAPTSRISLLTIGVTF